MTTTIMDVYGYQIQRYYNENDFKFAILPYIKNRELGFLIHKGFETQTKNSHRMMRAHNVQQLTFLNKLLNYSTRKIPFNWYMSVATYIEGIPKLSIAKEEKEQRKKICDNWKKINTQQIKQYDFIIDVDSPDHEHINDAVASAIALRNRLLEENKKFFIIFSGCGFHFHIQTIQEKENYNPYDTENIYRKYLDMARIYHDEVSELIDLNIYDSRRVIKIPHSISIYPNHIFICKPIIYYDELEQFKLEDYTFNAKDSYEFQKPYIFQKIIK